MTLILQGLKIKINEPKKRRVTSSSKLYGKIVTGTVIEQEDETFKVEIDLDNNGVKSPKLLNFTPESFEIVDRISVFTKIKDERGHRTRIIRDAWRAKFHPGSTDKYLPFDNHWIVKGHIVRDGYTELFKFKELVGINGYIIPDI